MKQGMVWGVKGAVARRCRLFGLAVLVWAGTGLAGSALAAAEVTIEHYTFTPQEIRIAAGERVRWLNQEKRTSHSVLFSAEQGGESERIFPGESWSRQFELPGRYPYTCGPHPEMKGWVVVE